MVKQSIWIHRRAGIIISCTSDSIVLVDDESHPLATIPIPTAGGLSTQEETPSTILNAI